MILKLFCFEKRLTTIYINIYIYPIIIILGVKEGIEEFVNQGLFRRPQRNIYFASLGNVEKERKPC